MRFIHQKIFIKVILAFFIAAISPYANSNFELPHTQAANQNINDLLSNNTTQTQISDQLTSNNTLLTSLQIIQDDVKTPNVTKKFRDWAKEVQVLEDDLNTVVYDEIQKVDTLIETQRVIDLNNKIIEKVKEKVDEIEDTKKTTETSTFSNHTIIRYSDPDYNGNEDAWTQHIYTHYLEQAKKLKELFNFNQVFECLMIKAEIGAEVNGDMLSHEEFVSMAMGEGLIACSPGPNYQKSLSKKSESSDTSISEPVEISDTTTSEEQAPPMAINNKQSLYSKFISKIIPKAFASKSEPSIPSPTAYEEAMSDTQKLMETITPYLENLNPESQEAIDLQNSINNAPEPKSGNPPTQEFLAPPLEFENPAEIKVLLPQTLTDLDSYYNQGTRVDQRIYYLLYHVFKTMKMEGETYERYLADKVIQDASTPGQIKVACSKNIEDNPEKCNAFANMCGILSAEYFVTDMMFGNIVNNIGVPYKDRAHLKIWLGLNAPYKSDEIGKDEPAIVNTHYDLKAIDISEIGLYNESVDCAACGDILSCKAITAIFTAAFIAVNPAHAVLISSIVATLNAIPIVNILINANLCINLCKIPLLWGTLCRPCCPPMLDSANPNTLPVKVKWQNEDYGSILSDLGGSLLDEALPFDETNGFSINNMLKGLAQESMEQLFNSGFKDFDVAKLGQSGFETFMSKMGNQWLDEKVFGKLGLPEGFASSTNWLNPDPQALVTSITGNYLDEKIGLEFGSFTPIISAMMSGKFKDAALSALNFTPNLNLPPKLQEAMNVAIQNGDNPKAMGLAYANLGLKELNSNVLGWPDGILDLDSFSGEGFVGIANKLGQHGLAQIEGLPTNFIFDINNPKNTAASLASSLLSDVTDNQRINQAITTAISQNTDFSLNSAMQLMQTEDLSKIFDINSKDAQLIKDFIDNPSSTPFVAFKNTMLSKIDFDNAALKNLNFTPESLELLFDYGLNPAYTGDNSQAGSLMMSALSNSIKLDKYGIELNKTDIEKLAYLQEHIQILNNLPESQNPYPSYEFNYNPSSFSAEIQKLSQNYSQRFGNNESIIQFQERITNTIDQAVSNPESVASKTKNEISYLTRPIKIKFSERVKKDELSEIDYIDTTYNEDPNTSNQQLKTIQGVLRSLNIDLNSMEITHSSIFEKKANDTLSTEKYDTDPQNISILDQINNSNSQPYNYQSTISSGYFEPNQIYYATPKIDLAEIALPGIRGKDTYHNNIGALKLLDTTTNITKYAQDYPILITPITSQNQQIPNINISQFSPGINLDNSPTTINPETNSNITSDFPQIQNILNQDPLKTAFLDKYQFDYKLPDNSDAIFDYNNLLGGSETIYNTLNNIGKNNTLAENNLSNIGTMVVSSAMTGIDIANLFSNDNNPAVLEDKITELTNVMGIVKSWQTGDIDTGMKSMTSFLKNNGVFDNISNDSAWDIGENGSIKIDGVDPLKIYADIDSGNYIKLLENIPFIQDKFDINNEVRNKIGTDPSQLLGLIQDFSPQKATDTVLEIMTNKITSESGLEKIAVAQELANTLGIPPDPKNIPKLLESDFIQTNVLKDIDPAMLGDISGIYGLVAGGNITPQKAVSTIMTANFFQEAIGKEAMGEFMSDYGGMINAALTGDPQAIASSIISSPKIADKLDSFFADQGIGDYFSAAGIQSLINGDIEGFIKDTSMKVLEKELLSKIDGPLGGLIGNSVLSILNGEFPSEALMQFATEYLIAEFLVGDSSLLQSLGGSFTNGFTLSPALFISIAGDFLNSAITGPIFDKCKKKIAQDNIIHFLDMVLAFDRNKTAHLKYNITMTDEDGQIIEATDENGFPIDNPNLNPNPQKFIKNYYPLQIFSDFASTVEDKISPKSKEKYDYIWNEDRFDFLNVFVKKCEDRENPFLTNCEDAIHIGF